MKKIISLLFITFFGCNFLSAQSVFDHTLARHKGNKIVLLGEWRAADTAKWREVIDADGVYEHGFLLVDRQRLMSGSIAFGALNRDNIVAFERYFRQRHGLSNTARWAALDIGSNLIASGTQVLESKDFERRLDERRIKSPLRQVRDFLRENPDHIDAKTDLLKEVRRRALHAMPKDAIEDLDTEKDLRTWEVLAAETDRVFNGSWLGIDLDFFKPEQNQPERFSKLMRNAFAKHIPKVEDAVRLEPTNNTLWNIWAWMARSMPDYKWEPFINSFEPIAFARNQRLITTSIPSNEACAWIIQEARAKNDWGTVVKFAKVARLFFYNPLNTRGEWVPTGAVQRLSVQAVESYPAKSAYAPLLEAHLMLGDIEAANNAFDEMMRLPWGAASHAAIAAEVARSAGRREIAEIWEKGGQINHLPYAALPFPRLYFPFFVASNNKPENRFSTQFRQLISSLPGIFTLVTATEQNMETLGWNKYDDERWALIAEDGKILAQDTAIPDPETLQALLIGHNVRSEADLYRKYISDHGSTPGVELTLAFDVLSQAVSRTATQSDDKQGEIAYSESARYLSKVLREHPEVMVNLPNISTSLTTQNESMKLLAKPMLANIESLLEKKPSSDALWGQWMVWKNIKSDDRSLEPVVERVKLSPLSQTGMVPPLFVISAYYEECKKNGNWAKVIMLLKTAWDREFERVCDPIEGNMPISVTKANIGNNLGIPLIEAYLHDGKPLEADEIFNAVLDCGGTFTTVSKIVELAKEKGFERYSREWEGKTKKMPSLD
ncbi:MAG: hypothetical protein LBH03_06050 [Holophagales bacterium]|jgi:hypothetical protein|nr:hypothetical protein [Holophagales bacterium]